MHYYNSGVPDGAPSRTQYHMKCVVAKNTACTAHRSAAHLFASPGRYTIIHLVVLYSGVHMLREGNHRQESSAARKEEMFAPPSQLPPKSVERATVPDVEKAPPFETVALLLTFEEFLDEVEEAAGGDRTTVSSFQKTFAALTLREQKRVLALPYELRKRRLAALHASTRGDGREMVAALLAHAVREGWTVGYHLSPVDIRPRAGEWVVQGIVVDGRDAAPMAHCSISGDALYLGKPVAYLYVVRVLERIARYDATGKWARARNFSIITRIPWQELVAALEEQRVRAHDSGHATIAAAAGWH